MAGITFRRLSVWGPSYQMSPISAHSLAPANLDDSKIAFCRWDDMIFWYQALWLIRSDPLIFGPPDPVLFSLDPEPTCNNGFIELFSSWKKNGQCPKLLNVNRKVYVCTCWNWNPGDKLHQLSIFLDVGHEHESAVVERQSDIHCLEIKKIDAHCTVCPKSSDPF